MGWTYHHVTSCIQGSAKVMQIQVGHRHEGHCDAGFPTAALAGLAQGIVQLV
jgi:3-deoxy-D-arabino-heptulosonate 7-phosphate (DAHP) synthase class II